jgi:hypothetical protein
MHPVCLIGEFHPEAQNFLGGRLVCSLSVRGFAKTN